MTWYLPGGKSCDLGPADDFKLQRFPADEPYEGEKGGVIIRLHKRYGRDPKLVSEKREEAKRLGKLSCEVCQFDFKDADGELGDSYIEVHQARLVHRLTPGSTTKLTDLALLCANCQRALSPLALVASTH